MAPETKRTTIVYVHANDEMYGSDFVLLELIKSLDRAQFAPAVVLPKDGSYPGLLSQELRKIDVPTYHMDLAVLRRRYFKPLGFIIYVWRLVFSTLAIARLIKKESVSLVHSNTVSVFPGAFAAWLTHRKHIWHVHEIITRPRALNRLIAWLVPRLSSTVVAVSAATRQHLCDADSLNEPKSIVIHNGIDPNPFLAANGTGGPLREQWGIREGDIVIGMVGRVSHWKGQDHLLESARLVLERHSQVRFVLVGGTVPGHEELLSRLKQKAADLGVNGKVIFAGFRRDIPAVLDAFDISVLPSTLPDPLPTVVLEAMAAGKPVVANAHGGSLEMVEADVTGFLVDPSSPKEMADAICRLLECPELRKRMGEKGRERVTRLFSPKAFRDRWCELYDRVLNRNKDCALNPF